MAVYGCIYEAFLTIFLLWSGITIDCITGVFWGYHYISHEEFECRYAYDAIRWDEEVK